MKPALHTFFRRALFAALPLTSVACLPGGGVPGPEAIDEPTGTHSTATTTQPTSPTVPSTTGSSSTADVTTGSNPTSTSSTTVGGTTATSAASTSTTTTTETTTSTTTTTAPRATTTAKPTTTSTGGTPQTAGRGNSAFVWGYDATPPPSTWRKPALGVGYVDQAYGTKIRRVSSAAGTRFNRNTYSRRQAENANGTLFMTYHGTAAYHIYSLSDLSLVAALDIHPDSEPQWHPSKPNALRHLIGSNSSVGGLQLLETDVRSGRTTTIADLTDRITTVIPSARYFKDRAEGAPSHDGDRYAWIVYDGDEEPVGLVSYDLAVDRVLGITTDLAAGAVDWVGMSPTGRHVVAGHRSGTYVYDAALNNRRLVTRQLEHSDFALGRDGRDQYVYIDFGSSAETGGWLVSVDLDTLQRTKIFDLFDKANTSIHISGTGHGKPGWVLVSTYNCKVSGAWSCNKVMAVELATNGRVLNLAHTNNCGDNYWTETHAVVNRSFTRAYFNSDAGSCGIDAEVYQLEIPSFD